MATILSSILVLLAACSQNAPSTVRPFPEGNSVAASRPLNPSATPVVPTLRAPLTPGYLVIPDIGVNATVVPLGTAVAPAPFLGGREVSSFEVPADLSTVGWWRDGVQLGKGGMAVLLGHSQVGGGYAVFNRIGELRPSAEIFVETSDGRQRATAVVTEVVTGISKDDATALQTALARNAPSSDLALVTCSGPFDTGVSESEQNTVVFARLR